jgi:hypothetical protein
MLATMSWGQFAMWIAYSEVEPFDEIRADLRAGVVASVVANANRDPKRTPRAFQATDFMPFLEDRGERKPLTDRGQWASVKAMARAYSKGGDQ